MRRAWLPAGLVTCLWLGGAATAYAAPPAKGGGGSGWKQETSPVQREPPWAAFARVGRARAKQGDCKTALDAFDEALRVSADASVNRDRGLCHDQLGHIVPAIEDYRLYLTQYGDAEDAEDIRGRLARLEAQQQGRPPTDVAVTDGAGVPAQGGVNASATGSTASVSLTAGAPPRGAGAGEDTRADYPRGKNLDAVQQWERKEADAITSPLRRGRGFLVGFFGTGRAWAGLSPVQAGNSFGIAFRYALGPVHTLQSELGYASIQSAGTANAFSGLSTYLGYEARLALDPFVTNAIYLGGGLGYEHLSRPSLGAVFANLFPRGRVGFRHAFGASVGIEVGADAGYAMLFMLNAPGTATNTQSFVIGGNLALLLAF